MENLDINGYENEIIKEIGYFIETQATERDVDGILILFSGYIDSTTIAKLVLDTFKDKTVKLLVRQEKFSKNQEEILNSSIDFLGLGEEDVIQHDIEPLFDQLKSKISVSGSIKEITKIYEPLSYNLLNITAKEEIIEKTYGMIGTPDTEREKLVHNIIALNKLRSRIHMTIAYLIAEQENLLFLGTINKTELLTGLFTKWGHGHCADLMPFGDLYRSQILQLAKFLGIPESIRSLAKADLMPGVQNKYEYFFDLSAYGVDNILIRLEDGLTPAVIHEETGTNVESIESVSKYFNSSAFERAAPLIPKIKKVF